jgi:hypothetical protein
MTKSKKDPIREERIHNEVVVDAYGAEEQAMGWYYYLEDKIRFPSRQSVSWPRWCRRFSKEKRLKSSAWLQKKHALPTSSC